MTQESYPMTKKGVLQFLVDLDHYATWTETLIHFGLDKADKTDTLLCQLRDESDIILDGDKIIVTAVTNPKLQELIDKSVRLSPTKAMEAEGQ